MGLTTERKIFLALALVAGASLVVDQAILSPSGASAASLDADQIASKISKQFQQGVSESLKNQLGKK